MIDFLNINDNITDEQLAAYIDGNATAEESAIIEQALNNDSLLVETIDVVQDCLTLQNHPWDIYQGSDSHWDLGLPPLMDHNNMFPQGNNLGIDNEYEKNIFQGDSFLNGKDTMCTDDIVSIDLNPLDI